MAFYTDVAKPAGICNPKRVDAAMGICFLQNDFITGSIKKWICLPYFGL